ncbi:MAG: hypothetical protein IJF78_06510 [Clostridia bacterium]|nr:hypothetical protein [Clostridia bacterium]
MKRIAYLCAILLFLFRTPVITDAAEFTYEKERDAEKVMTEGWESILEYLPEEIGQEASEMNLTNGGGIRDKVSLRYWAGQIMTGIRENLSEIIPGILPLFSMILILSAVELSIQNSPSQNLQKAFSVLSSLTSAVVVFGMTDRIMSSAQLYLNRLCGIMNLLTPVMEGLYLAGGDLTQKAVTTEAVMLGVTLVGNFSGQLLAPMTNLLFTLSCVGGVCGDVKISGFTAGLRKLIMRLWQFGTLLFSFLLSVQSILAKSADSLAAKTARFAIGSFIPVAGGVIAEAYSTLKEGISVLRSTAGIGGIVVILLLLIPGIVPLVLYKCVLSVAETVSEALNLNGLRGMLGEVHGIADMLFAFVLYTSLMFVLAVMIFAKSRAGL